MSLLIYRRGTGGFWVIFSLLSKRTISLLISNVEDTWGGTSLIGYDCLLLTTIHYRTLLYLTRKDQAVLLSVVITVPRVVCGMVVVSGKWPNRTGEVFRLTRPRHIHPGFVHDMYLWPATQNQPDGVECFLPSYKCLTQRGPFLLDHEIFYIDFREKIKFVL